LAKVHLNLSACFPPILLFATILLFQSAFGQKELIKTIYFKNNSYRIESKYNQTLNELAEICRIDSSYFIKIFGYTDTTGGKDVNDKLSKKRVLVIYDYLSSRITIDSTKIYMEWLGKSDDVYDLHFPQAHIQQRCVDIWILFFNKKKRAK
jgi:outer membrane protein OmpA-like peptidoglycan-associated protein